MRHASIAQLALATLSWSPVAPAASPPPDSAQLANVETVRIRTTDANGDTRERTIWLLVHEGHGFIRAGGTSGWDSSIDAVPDVAVQLGEVWYELRATRIARGELYDAVMSGMRSKYGLSDRLLSPFRALGGGPRILRLDPRPGLPIG